MRSYISTEDKANELKLLLKHPAYDKAVILVVEGETDLRFFENVVDEDIKVEWFEGKRQVIEIVEEMNDYSRVIGVCDLDFDGILGRQHCAGVYKTDVHDLEMQMCISPAINLVLREHCVQGRYTEIESSLLTEVLSAAKVLGAAKLANQENDYGLNFRGFSLFDSLTLHTSPLSLVVDFDDLINRVLQRSPNASCTRDELAAMTSGVIDRDEDPYHLCNGHDVTRLIAMVLNHRDFRRQGNLTSIRIEEGLRISYAAAGYFAETLLHVALRNWERTYEKYFFRQRALVN